MTISDTRIILIGAGIFLGVIGGIVLANDIPPAQYPAILLWLVGALVVHDLLISGAVFAVALAGRRATSRMPLKAILIAQSALAIGAITALLVVPEVIGKAAGSPANPSILPLDYGLNLAILLGALVIAAGAGIALHVVLARSPSSSNVNS
ncbi:hypothetical protein [uncultured Microbacterium sp.]|uniref:hypothetical protein n=1 Tax=uncultured Microbacterium sp. TaxID=191216 RepID=UPI0035C999D2